MFRRNARWIWLTLFALGNLVCWLGVAVAFGLAVGDSVDLGVETLIRRGQATAVAMWEQASLRASQPAAMPVAEAEVSLPVQTEVAENRPPATPTWPAFSAQLATAQAEATQEARQPFSATPGTAADMPTPEPEATLVTSPLLLADPDINSLAELNAEMSRSAPDRAVQIRYQEGALNGEIAALWENNPELPFRDVRVDLKRDGVVVTGKTTILGFQVNADITGRVAAADCRPQLEIETVSLAGVLTPSFVRDQIEEMILEAVGWYPPDYPLCLEQIVLEETRATVYGYRR